jgi:hypothetical protein
MAKSRSAFRFVIAAALAAVALFPACAGPEDEFAGMTPCAEVAYPDTAGIAQADEPLVSFYATLDKARPLILREEDISTHLLMPDCDTREIGSARAEISYDEAGKESSLRLRLDELQGEIKLADLPRGESFCIKNDFLALQVVRAGNLEVSGAVFARYPHCSVAVKTPNPANWIIEAALTPPEAAQPAEPTEGGAEANDFGTGTPDLANLERFFLALQGGVVNNIQLTIQGQYTGDQSVSTGQMFFSPAPATPAEADEIKSTTEKRIRELYLDAPGWKAAERLSVEALGWNEPYFSNLVNWSGMEVDIRLTWSDPASGTVVYQTVDTVGLVRWTDFLWYVDTDHILRQERPAAENRLWTGCPPSAMEAPSQPQ